MYATVYNNRVFCLNVNTNQLLTRLWKLSSLFQSIQIQNSNIINSIKQNFPGTSPPINNFNYIAETPSFKLNDSPSTNFRGKINLTTRNGLRQNTYEWIIINQQRPPNKSTNKTNTTAIATQTEDVSNERQGRTPLRLYPHNPIYPLDNTRDMPENKKNYPNFGEDFLAKANTKDRQWNPL